jgi:hypothetical protein
MISRSFYFIYNLIYQIAILFCLLYANTYLNDDLVPERLIWRNNGRRIDLNGLVGYATIKAMALIAEAAILILIIYVINRMVLSSTRQERSKIAIANRTARIGIIVSVCFIALLIWGSFRGLIW